MMIKAQRGFTLLELGVVLAVVGILIAVTVPQVSSQAEVSKRKRLETELINLGESALTYWTRTVQVSGAGCDDGVCEEQAKLWSDGGSAQNLATGTVTIDLANASSATLRAIAPTTVAGFNGTNPFGAPYQVVLHRRRVTVSTCVPDAGLAIDLPRLSTTNCGIACSGANGVSLCFSQAALPGRIPDVAFEKRYLHFGQDGSSYATLP